MLVQVIYVSKIFFLVSDKDSIPTAADNMATQEIKNNAWVVVNRFVGCFNDSGPPKGSQGSSLKEVD